MTSNFKKNLLLTLDFPPKMGGVAEYYHQLCTRMPKNSIVVVAPYQNGCEEFDNRQPYPIIRSKKLTSIVSSMQKSRTKKLPGLKTLSWMTLSKHIVPIIRAHRVELLHIGQILPLGTVALQIKKQTGVPFLLYAHGMDITVPAKISRKKLLLKRIINSSDIIIANSYFTHDQLIALGAEQHKIYVIQPCPCIDVIEPLETSRRKILKDWRLEGKKIILSVGRLVERKGFDMVIEAMPKILTAVPSAQYIIAGDGPDKKRLQEKIYSKKLGEHIQLVGKVGDDQLAALYDMSEIFVMPSRMLPNGDVEGFGIVYLEANAYGTPVIGGRSGGIPEAILDKKTGLLVDPNDKNEIAEKILFMLKNPNYANRLGMQGMQRVAENFSWDDQVRKLIEATKNL